MDFWFGLLTGIFAFVATFAIFVVHVLKINLDLDDPKNDFSHNGISGESVRARASNNDFTDISETRLRQMIQKIIAETISLPPLSKTHAVSEIALDRRSKASDNRPLGNGYYPRHRTEHYFEPTIYQDLLATAVLNKIVDKQLNNNHEVAESDTGGGVVGDGEGEEVNDNIRLAESDQNFNIEKLSTTSGSSVEPRSDCSYPEMEQLLNTNDDKSSELIRNSDRDSVMSDYLASHLIPLPDLNAMATESEEEDYMSVTSSAIGDGTWEKNWLFKKKKSGLSSSVTTNSVGMLVPDPKEDVRAQIGDKTADEVSDLSELGSDTDDSLDSLRSKLEPINNRLANKHLIGGQNNKIILDELIERSSMISNTLQSNQDILDACNEHVIDAPTKTEAINDNVTQQESAPEQKGNTLREALCSVVLEDQNSNSLAGSIAEREYKKWYNAVEMPNNPYAPEALKRRISGSQERFIDLPNISPTNDLNPLELLNNQKLDEDENTTRESDYKRYSRDYYINSSLTTPQISPARDVSARTTKDIREVNNNNYNNINNNNNSYQNKSRNANTKHFPNDCHWTLSTPVRRSSSLKYLNKNINSPPPPYQQAPPTYHQHNKTSSILQTRPSTSTSYYNHFNNLNNDDNEDEDDNLDLHSQRSWKSSSALSSKRRTVSMLSLFSVDSSRSSNMSRNNHKDANVLTQFEKQLLHKDLKRNSFRAVSATTKDFVLNPLYERDQFFNGDKALKLSIVKPLQGSQETNRHEEPAGDSGIDSCLNYPNDSKQYDNTLLF